MALTASTHGTVDFYVAVTATIPLLLLVYMFQIPTVVPRSGPMRIVRLILSLLNMAFVFAGEVAALIALYRDAEVGVVIAVLAWTGVACLVIPLAYFVARRIIDPKRQRHVASEFTLP